MDVKLPGPGKDAVAVHNELGAARRGHLIRQWAQSASKGLIPVTGEQPGVPMFMVWQPMHLIGRLLPWQHASRSRPMPAAQHTRVMQEGAVPACLRLPRPICQADVCQARGILSSFSSFAAMSAACAALSLREFQYRTGTPTMPPTRSRVWLSQSRGWSQLPLQRQSSLNHLQFHTCR